MSLANGWGGFSETAIICASYIIFLVTLFISLFPSSFDLANGKKAKHS